MQCAQKLNTKLFTKFPTKHTGTFFSHFLHTLASNENKNPDYYSIIIKQYQHFYSNKKIISDKMLIHTRMGAFSMNFFSFASEKKQEIIP